MQGDIEVDFVLVGGGLAPLVVARELLERGASVVLLNPDREFFMQGSELPLDPISDPSEAGMAGRLDLLDVKTLLDRVAPVYPGAVESLPREQSDFFDHQAPWVRRRDWIWVFTEETQADRAADALTRSGQHALRVRDAAVRGRIPGIARDHGSAGTLWGVVMPRAGDVDLLTYQWGLAEFLGDKLGEHMVRGCADFRRDGPGRARWTGPSGQRRAVRARERAVYFSAQHCDLWEEWSLVSRDPIDPGHVAILPGGVVLYSPAEGDSHKLHVFKKVISAALGLASAESFESLWKTCRGYLGWEKFSIAGLRRRAVGRGLKTAAEPDGWTVLSGTGGGVGVVVGQALTIVEQLAEGSL